MPTSRHEHVLTVRSYELDPYRHVNNASYVSWLEDARELFLREEERDYGWYPDRLSAWFVVVRLDCEYLSSAQAAERVAVSTRLVRLGRSSVTFRQCICRASDGMPRARARVVMAFADDGGRSMAIPEDFRARFVLSEAGDAWTPEEGGERGDPAPAGR